jgi:hypothetical protein
LLTKKVYDIQVDASLVEGPEYALYEFVQGIGTAGGGYTSSCYEFVQGIGTAGGGFGAQRPGSSTPKPVQALVSHDAGAVCYCVGTPVHFRPYASACAGARRPCIRWYTDTELKWN